MKTYKINIPIYETELCIWIGGEEKDFIAKINKMFSEKLIPDGRSGCFISLQKNKYNKDRITDRILWIEKYDEATLIHEIFHAVSNIMAYKNIHLTETSNGQYDHSSEEAWAYLLEYLYMVSKKTLSK